MAELRTAPPRKEAPPLRKEGNAPRPPERPRTPDQQQAAEMVAQIRSSKLKKELPDGALLGIVKLRNEQKHRITQNPKIVEHPASPKSVDTKSDESKSQTPQQEDAGRVKQVADELDMDEKFVSPAVLKYVDGLSEGAREGDTRKAVQDLKEEAAGVRTGSATTPDEAMKLASEMEERLDNSHLKRHLVKQVADVLLNPASLVRHNTPDENGNYGFTPDVNILPQISEVIRDGNMNAIFKALDSREESMGDEWLQLDKAEKAMQVPPAERQEHLDHKKQLVEKMLDSQTTRQILIRKGLVKGYIDHVVSPGERPVPRAEVGSWSEIIEPTADSSMQDIQKYLTTEAKNALKKPTFKERNQQMANAVAVESSVLAAKSIGNNEAAGGLRDILNTATVEAGNAFAGVFDQFGNSLPDKKAEYDQAMKDAKQVAYKNLPELYKAAGIEGVDVDSLLKRIDFNDVLRFTAKNLGVSLPNSLSPEQIKQSLHETAKGDYYEGKIDTLPFTNREPRTVAEQHAIDLAARMANATWKAGQVHRATWEGNDSRIDHTQRDRQFNPYDLFIKEQFAQFSEKHPPEEAIIRVAFEVNKDIDNLVRAIPQPVN